MNDRFKFRVWDKGQTQYINNPSISFFSGYLHNHNFDNFNAFIPALIRSDLFIVEQCTGLKDKNGNLIYEGDVVRMSGRVLAVWWDCDCACWMLGANEIGGYFPSQLEIIGNIHEQKDAA